MNTISKNHFLNMLKYRPLSMIGRQIIYDKHSQTIQDISLSGDSILLDKHTHGVDWYPADKVEDPVVIDAVPEDTYQTWDGKKLTVKTLMDVLDELHKQVGKPYDEHSLSLFEIVAALQKRVEELRKYIEAMENKKEDSDRTTKFATEPYANCMKCMQPMTFNGHEWVCVNPKCEDYGKGKENKTESHEKENQKTEAADAK